MTLASSTTAANAAAAALARVAPRHDLVTFIAAPNLSPFSSQFGGNERIPASQLTFVNLQCSQAEDDGDYDDDDGDDHDKQEADFDVADGSDTDADQPVGNDNCYER